MNMETLRKIFNDNHMGVIAAAVIITILFWTYGCQSTCRSLKDPTQKISRGELQIEVDTLLATAKLRLEELDKQDELRLLIFEQASLFAQTGTVNPMGLLTTGLSIFAVGFGLDRNRKVKELSTTLDALKNADAA